MTRIGTQIGRRRHRVTIQRLETEDLDSRGQLSSSFIDAEKNVLCSVVHLTGDERQLAKQTFADATHTVNMRWRDGMTTADQLIFGSRTFHILEINNVQERNRELILTVGEAV